MTTYYVPQSMTTPIDPHRHPSANSMVPLQYQAVGPSAFSQPTNNNTITSFPISNKRSTPPHHHQTHINTQPTQNNSLQLSSATSQPYSAHYNPVTAATMIFATPNLYPGMVATYHSSTQPGSSPMITSPSSSVSSSSNPAITASSPPVLCEPSSPANTFTSVVHTASSPTDINKPSTEGSPVERFSPPKPVLQNNRYSSDGSYPRPRNTEQNASYNYTNNNNNPSAYQPNKFKTSSLQYKRPPGEQTHHLYTNNHNFHQTYQPTPLVNGGAVAQFRHVNTAVHDKFRSNGLRNRPPNLDLRRSASMSSSSIVSPNTTNDISTGEQQSAATATTPTTVHHIPHTSANNFRMANSFVDGAAAALHHQQQQAYYGAAGGSSAVGPASYSGVGGGSPGMYVKLGGAFFAHHVSCYIDYMQFPY